MSIEKRASFVNADRRQLPRVAITMPVALTRAKGQKITGLMQNISPGGMLVRLSDRSAATLLPRKDAVGSDGIVPIHAQFLVPLREARVPISVSCLVAHVSPVDGAPTAARIAVGFRFKQFRDNKTLRRFVAFIEEQLVPMEDYQLYLHGPSLRRPKPEGGKNSKTRVSARPRPLPGAKKTG